MNSVQLVGNVGRDPELRTTPSGLTILKFSVATTHSWKKDGGDWQRDTDWHDIVVFGGFAQSLAGRLRRGAMVAISGRMKTGSYERDGKKIRTVDIVPADVRILERSDGGQGRPAPAPAPVESSEFPASDLPF